MSARTDALASRIDARLAGRVGRVASLADEVAIEVAPADLLEVCRTLRDDPELGFEMLMDVCGVDYLDYGHDEWTTYESTVTGFSRGVEREQRENASGTDRRFAVVYHLLSIRYNWRLRVRTYCPDPEQPAVDSLTGIWASADWFEREAFDLFGILFKGHPDLRRILTDYGFIGHPFRKDFPLIGNVEVRYDPDKGRVIYQPVSIEPRTLVPKVIRDDNRYEPALKEPDPGSDRKDAQANG